MNKRHYEHTLPNIRGSLSNTYNTWLLYINVNNVGFYSSFISVLPFSLFSASPNVRFFIAPSESLCF